MGPPSGPPGAMSNVEIDPEKLELFKADQARDMEVAWKFLETKFKSKDLQANACLLKIEIGQRLESSVKLANAMDSIGDAKDMPSKMVAFTAAPLIGRWKYFMNIGNSLPPIAFQQFSEVSQNMPVPDY